MAITDKQRAMQQQVLGLMGIPLWQRLATDPPLDTSTSASNPPDSLVCEGSEQGSIDPVATASPDCTVIPTSLDALNEMRTAPIKEKDSATTSSPVILIRLSGNSLESPARVLLERMMGAIDVSPQNWEIHAARASADTAANEAESAIDVSTWCERKTPSAIVLLVPHQELQALSESLVRSCDQLEANSSGSSLAGFMPRTRISFCCLADPDDLLTDGTLKRHAWDTLQVLHHAIQKKVKLNLGQSV